MVRQVAQDRAVPDVRDFLKPGLRQGLYAQYSNKLTYKDKFQKAQKSVAAAESLKMLMGPDVDDRRNFLFENVDFNIINS